MEQVVPLDAGKAPCWALKSFRRRLNEDLEYHRIALVQGRNSPAPDSVGMHAAGSRAEERNAGPLYIGLAAKRNAKFLWDSDPQPDVPRDISNRTQGLATTR
jgi:hypothetical protein